MAEDQLLDSESFDQVKSLVYSSVDDTKSSLPHRFDPVILEEALQLAEENGYKTKAKLIRARIRRLKKGAR